MAAYDLPQDMPGGDIILERLQRALGEPHHENLEVSVEFEAVVLVLDDNGLDRRALTRGLRQLHNVAEILEAGTITAARDLLTEQKIDVAFFDLALPDGEGISLLPLARDRGVATVVVTGAGNERTAVRAMSAGAADYIVKDVAGEYLQLLPLTFERVLQRRHLELERTHLLARVEEALSLVRLLGSLVRVCCVCKKMKVSDEKWEPMEVYLGQATKAQVTHGYCPACYAVALREANLDA